MILRGGHTAWITTALALTPPILWLSRRFGRRFSAFSNWTIKLGISLGIAITGVLLNVTGFRASSGVAQAAGTILNMRLVDIAVPAAALSLAIIIVLRYPITDKQMEGVRRNLERRDTVAGDQGGVGGLARA